MNSSVQKLIERNLSRLLPSDAHVADYVDFFNQSPVPGLLTENLLSGPAADLLTEAVILRCARPGLLIHNGAFLPIAPWQQLDAHAAALQAVIPSVGRIDIYAGNNSRAVGTGWVFNNHLITNRHVAAKFYARNPGHRTAFMRLPGDTGRIMTNGIPVQEPYRATINFRVEAGARLSSEHSFKIGEPVYLAAPTEPDVAVLRVAPTSLTGNPLPPSLRLAATAPIDGQVVAVVGHPANDLERNPDASLLQAFFQGHYQIKRLQPGLITEVNASVLHHDCTTTGGNSGSPVLDVETGEVLGLHCRGEFMQRNSAVLALVLSDLFSRLELS